MKKANKSHTGGAGQQTLKLLKAELGMILLPGISQRQRTKDSKKMLKVLGGARKKLDIEFEGRVVPKGKSFLKGVKKSTDPEIIRALTDIDLILARIHALQASNKDWADLQRRIAFRAAELFLIHEKKAPTYTPKAKDRSDFASIIDSIENETAKFLDKKLTIGTRARREAIDWIKKSSYTPTTPPKRKGLSVDKPLI